MKRLTWNAPVEIRELSCRETGDGVPAGAVFVDNQFITVVSDQYRLIPNVEVVERVELALVDENFNQLYTEFNGRKFHVVYEILGHGLFVAGFDKVNPCLHIFNSYDGTRSFSIALAAMRYICTNYLVVGNPLVIKEIHRWDIVEGVIEQIKELVELQLKEMPEIGASWTKLYNTELHRARTLEIIDQIELPKSYNETVANLMEIEFSRNNRVTAWRLVNAYSYAITSPKAVTAGYAVKNKMTGRPLKLSMDKKRNYMGLVQRQIGRLT